uniref:chorismate-binding protein n=1 Tax=Aurantibacter sp. TaxID=2807103 RepID=UPI0035C79B54
KTNVKGVFQNTDTVFYTKDFTESGFVFSPFNSEEKSILIPLDASDIIEVDVLENTSEELELEKPKNEVDITAKGFHFSLVSKAIQHIKNHNFEKVVVSRKEVIPLKENNPIILFKRLLATYNNAFVYCWYHPKVGLWLGATPETLLSVTGNRFTTMSLAGTQAVNNKNDWQAKETEEQQLVTNYLVSNLQDSVSSLTIGKTETIKAGNLLHLRTKLSGVLNTNLKNVIAVLHPTPAVCGLPKQVTKTFILEYENYNREFYTGFLGELNLKEEKSRNTNRRNVENNAYGSIKKVSNLFVNLRCMQLTDTKAHIYIGGGITKDSIPENEWQETCNKTETMKNTLF